MAAIIFHTNQCWAWLSSPNASNWALAFVGIAGIIVAVWTLIVINRQTKATLLNAQSVFNSERAWVEIKLALPEKDPLHEEEDDFGIFSVEITNHGRTAARIESLHIGTGAVIGEPRLEGLNYKPVEKLYILLGRNEKPKIAHINFCYEFPDWQSIRDKKKSAVIHMIIKYRDIVGGSTLHETATVFSWNAALEQPERVSRFNVYT